MLALVTGASGFLGGRLVQILCSRGVKVRILARRTSDLSHLSGLPIETASGSLTDPQTLSAAMRGVTFIYHCAACSTDWAPRAVFESANVTGVRNLLLAAASANDLRRFVHISTTDVYGYPQEPCDESAPLVDVGLPYNSTKIRGENSVWEATSHMPVTILRPATIYGPRGKAFATDIAQLLRQGTMAVIDGGRAPGGFCYVDNAAEAIVQAAQSEATIGRAYNLADGSGVTWRRYVDQMADGLGVRRPWINLPSALAFALARATEFPHSALHIPGRPLLTRHAVYLLARNQEYPAGRGRQDFGFKPSVSFEEGLRRTLDWLKRA